MILHMLVFYRNYMMSLRQYKSIYVHLLLYI
nr:MAG TPA: hypothetical protein [Caudoviricetes sp.]DAK03943.1 MAG TPA: hypothetical protein [Crassvirales sp.]